MSAAVLAGCPSLPTVAARPSARGTRRASPRCAVLRAAATADGDEPRPVQHVASSSRRTFFSTAFAASLSALLVESSSAYDTSPSRVAELSELADAALAPVLGELAAAAPGAEVYFGNGCFWGRQHEFVEAERKQGRSNDEVTSLVGYAGGLGLGAPSPKAGSTTAAAAAGKVCYYYGAVDTVYDRLGHGEVVRTSLSAGDSDAAVADLRLFSATYFKNFRKVRGFGMQRLDPQDAGPGYRNMIGLPGGMDSPLFGVIEAENVNGMKLVRGQGNAMKGNNASEDDVFNAVWIYDSDALPFYAAEVYHQFHDGMGYKFPEEYTAGLKRNALKRGLVKPTGCPEMRERSFAEFESIGA